MVYRLDTLGEGRVEGTRIEMGVQTDLLHTMYSFSLCVYFSISVSQMSPLKY